MGVNMIRMRCIVKGFVLMAWVCTAHAVAPAGGAEIVSVQGKGEVRTALETPWREAVAQQILNSGASVRTLDASRMAVMLADQTQLRLAPNSVVEIKQVGDGAARATQLQQSSGRTWAQSKNIPDKLTVQTPTALAAIRGTDWELVVDDDGTSTLTVLSGQVLLSNDMGSVHIDSGEQGRAQKGVPPTKATLIQPRDRVQWVSSFAVDIKRYPDLSLLPHLAAPFAANDFAAARKAVQQLAPHPDAPASAALLMADFSVQDGDFDLADKTLALGAARYPTDERFDVWRARLYLVRDDVPAARAALAQARHRNPHSTEMMLAEGELERLEGNATAATAAYQSAIAQAPDMARAWHGLGVVQTEREDVANAQTSLKRALALEPQGTGFLAELGTLEAFADRLDAARTAFTQALQERPDDYVALTGLALVELKSGNAEAATRLLLAASLIEPRYARAQTLLAVAYYQQGRTRDALFVLARARALDPKDPLPDMYQSVIYNDLLQPGDALESARKALALLPYLKSLNQVANDQKGGANLGSALAAFGLEDWARSYAQDSYTPFWAGSHLFLADRYSGDFNKKSELFQGFLADPTVFGASNRFSTLIGKPGHYGSLSLRHKSSADFKLSEPTLNLNGFANSAIPFAYFVEAIRTQARPDQMAFDAAANTYTVAVGARPSHALGLFLYANAFNADIVSGLSKDVRQFIVGRNDRIDVGAHYRFGPESQAWLKLGQGTETSRADTITSILIDSSEFTNCSCFETHPEQRDLQWRHTFAISDSQEWSWGAETSRMAKSYNQVTEKFLHSGVGIIPADIVILQEENHSDDVWFSGRIRAREGLDFQFDLARQHFVIARDIDTTHYKQIPPRILFNEDDDRIYLAPRWGASYAMGGGATLRYAWQRWLRPASFNTLSPVATVGIPVDDSMLNPGGRLARWRMQLDWETSADHFVTAFVDHRQMDNLTSKLEGVVNKRPDTANLSRVRQSVLSNLAAPDQLEANPVFSRGTVSSVGATANQVLTGTLAGYLGYANSHSENTSVQYLGNALPYLPDHRLTLGLTWSGENRVLLSAQTVWRSERFADEANLVPLAPGWDMTLRLHWETMDKRWAVDGYALNLLKPDAERTLGVNLVARF